MKVVLSPNPYRDKGLKVAQNAQRVLESSGVETVFCLPFSMEEGQGGLPGHLTFVPFEQALPQTDLLICFGGDGTILHAAKGANAYHVPILGVNLGSVGFMAELEQSELSVLGQLAGGNYTLERRMMLDVKVRHQGRIVREEVALNDAVVTKGAVARVIDLAVHSDRTLICEFSGDGVIVSTPTGSTAYSMAAGGPIVEPTAENLIVTPICSHSMHAKSFVLGQERVIAIRTGRTSRKNAYLSVDGGKAFRLTGGDMVEITRSEKYTSVVKLSGRSFYELIHQKLGGQR